MRAAASQDQGGLSFFSGESEDHKDYRRWKAWVQSKMMTLDKMPKEARGAYVFTLLSGKALECVEHLDPSAFQKEGGEKVLFDLLDQRFPQKEVTDEMSEVLTPRSSIFVPPKVKLSKPGLAVPLSCSIDALAKRMSRFLRRLEDG